MRFFGQLRKAIIERLAADVGAGTKGRFWFNTTTDLPKCDDGATVEQIMLEKHLPLARRTTKVQLDDAGTGNEIAGTLPATKGGTGETYIPFNYSASAPTANDDSGDGYGQGTRWWDATTNILYICEDATVAAAIWIAAGNIANLPVITTKATTYTALTTDEIIHVTTASAWTLTLYTASGNAGRRLKIVKTGSGFNQLTIDANAAELINGNATTNINTQHESVDLLCDGTGWVIENRNSDTGWVDFTFTGTFTTNTTYSGEWRRLGDSMEARIYISWGGASTTSFLGIDIPESLTIATDKIALTTSTNRALGDGSIVDLSLADTHILQGAYNNSSSVQFQHWDPSDLSIANVNGSGSPMTIASGDTASLRFSVPISGWKGQNQ